MIQDKSINQEQGFTMLEIVTVLVLLGIISAVAVPKYFDMQESSEKKAAEAALAEAQVRINAGYSKAIYAGKSCDEAVKTVNKIKLIADKGTDSAIGQFEFTSEDDTISDSNDGTNVMVKLIGGTKEYLGKLRVPSCDNESGGSSDESGIVCPNSGTDGEITCVGTATCESGTCTCTCTCSNGVATCTCTKKNEDGGSGDNEDDDKKDDGKWKWKPTPDKWGEDLACERRGMYVYCGSGALIESDGKYYVVMWHAQFSDKELEGKIENTSDFNHLLELDVSYITKYDEDSGEWYDPKSDKWERKVKKGMLYETGDEIYVFVGDDTEGKIDPPKEGGWITQGKWVLIRNTNSWKKS